MYPLPGGLKTPLPGLLPGISKTVKVAAFEEALFHVPHTIFDFGFILRVPHSLDISVRRSRQVNVC